jgi:hypothetical protein
MFNEITEEISRLEKELATAYSSLAKDLYAGQISGLRMAMAMLEGLNITEQKFFCWGNKILPIQELKISGKERARYTIQRIIENNRAVVSGGSSTTIAPYIQGHTIGLESVLQYL